ncbi:uncharacterized protein [Mobula birostris]|uniref:uncharacterized protein isoform X2 n=1 Tax=Mobula birostris TaxID=1983395 RepID=UPI003B28D0FB
MVKPEARAEPRALTSQLLETFGLHHVLATVHRGSTRENNNRMKNISFQLQRIQYGWTFRSKVTREIVDSYHIPRTRLQSALSKILPILSTISLTSCRQQAPQLSAVSCQNQSRRLDLLSLMSAPVSPNQCHLRMPFTLILLTIGQLSQVKESLQTDTTRVLPQPAISISSDRVFKKGEDVRIECRSPGLYPGSTFYLKRVGKATFDAQRTVPRTEDTATFNIYNVSASDQGTYHCFYRKQISRQWETSHLSSEVELMVHDAASEGQSSDDLPFKVNTWILIAIVAGAIVLGLIVIAIVWFVRRKISNARRNRNNRDNLWTTPDSNTCSPYRVSIRRSFRFSRDLETPREQEGENSYYASQSTEFLNDTQYSPRGLHMKPYFITFRE